MAFASISVIVRPEYLDEIKRRLEAVGVDYTVELDGGGVNYHISSPNSVELADIVSQVTTGQPITRISVI